MAEVVVAPQGYTGQADYYCTGTNDDILINAAIIYVSAAYGGGTVRLLEGTFNTTAQITYLSNVAIVGSGDSTLIKPSTVGAYVFAAIGTVGTNLTGIVLSRLKINGLLLATVSDVFFNYVTGGRIESVTLLNPGAQSGGGFEADNSDDIKILNNTIDGQLNVTLATCGIYSNGTTNLTISNNVIKRLRSNDGEVGIFTFNSNRLIITGNTLYDLSTTNAGNIIGIQTQGSRGTISNNRIEQIKNSNVAANAFGVQVFGSNNNVTGNYCYNNGSDTGIANTNSNNFSDSGTDTQIYSNSWQDPNTGEPNQGEVHWLPQATATVSGLVKNGATTSATWASMNFSGLVPVGAKSTKALVGVNATASASGAFAHFVAFSSDFSTVPTDGTHHPKSGIRSWSSDGTGVSALAFMQMDLPLDSAYKCYFYAYGRSNATNCIIYVAAQGYNA